MSGSKYCMEDHKHYRLLNEDEKTIQNNNENIAQFNAQGGQQGTSFHAQTTTSGQLPAAKYGLQTTGESSKTSKRQPNAIDQVQSSVVLDSHQKAHELKSARNSIRGPYSILKFTDEEKSKIHAMIKQMVLYGFKVNKAQRVIYNSLKIIADIRTFRSNIQLQKKIVNKRGRKAQDYQLDEKIIGLHYLFKKMNEDFKVTQTSIRLCEEVFLKKYSINRKKLWNKKRSIENQLRLIKKGRREQPDLIEIFDLNMRRVYYLIHSVKNKKYQKLNLI